MSCGVIDYPGTGDIVGFRDRTTTPMMRIAAVENSRIQFASSNSLRFVRPENRCDVQNRTGRKRRPKWNY